jgi:hypothetical protein
MQRADCWSHRRCEVSGGCVYIVLLLGFLLHCRMWRSCPCTMTSQNVFRCSVALGDQWDVTSAVSRSRRQPWLWLMGEQSVGDSQPTDCQPAGRPSGSNTSLCSPACKMNHKIVKQWVKLTRFVTLKMLGPQCVCVMCQLFEYCNKWLLSHRDSCVHPSQIPLS